jgi:hypothetical protein
MAIRGTHYDQKARIREDGNAIPSIAPLVVDLDDSRDHRVDDRGRLDTSKPLDSIASANSCAD